MSERPLCACGCGSPVGTYSATTKTHRKGEPTRFLHGHAGRLPRRRQNPLDAIDDYSIDERGCWVFRRALNAQGYGVIWQGNRRYLLAHRVSYEHRVGQIPPWLVIDHLCRNEACINPAHLEPVPNRVNVLRGVGITARNAQKTECVNGHAFDEANTYIRPNGQRACRACRRRAVARHAAAERIARGGAL